MRRFLWILGTLAVLAAAALVYPMLLPWDASPRTKLALLALSVAEMEGRLDDLCKAGRLVPGLTQVETNIPREVSARATQPLQAGLALSVPATGEVVLHLSLPRVERDGPLALWHREAIVPGTKLARRGRCKGGALSWTTDPGVVPDAYLPPRWMPR